MAARLSGSRQRPDLVGVAIGACPRLDDVAVARRGICEVEALAC